LLPAAAAGAALVALAARRADSAPHFVLLAGFSLLLGALAISDARTLLLPNRLMYPGLVAALALAGAWPDHSLWSSLIGGLAGGAVMFALFVVLPGFGAGDVKLCALIGLLAGWPHIVGALVIGVLVNGLAAAVGVLSGRLRLRGAMPYGPGLIVGALVVLLL